MDTRAYRIRRSLGRETLREPYQLEVALANERLGLLEVKNRYTVRICRIIRDADRLDAVVALSHIPAHYPLAAGSRGSDIPVRGDERSERRSHLYSIA